MSAAGSFRTSARRRARRRSVPHRPRSAKAAAGQSGATGGEWRSYGGDTGHTATRPSTEKDSWTYTGNAGVWAQISVDEQLGIAYLPVEQPTVDYYGGHRPGNGLFGESLVAVDVRTGQRKWHYQFVHQGLWDMDLPCAPILVDVTVIDFTPELRAEAVKAIASAAAITAASSSRSDCRLSSGCDAPADKRAKSRACGFIGMSFAHLRRFSRNYLMLDEIDLVVRSRP